MSNLNGGGGLFGDLLPEGEDRGGRFRSRQELEEENARLRAELAALREENTLLADMLAERFDEDNGEIHGEEPDGEGNGGPGGRRHLVSNFVISDAAIDLFEDLPARFTLDEALEAALRLRQSSAKASDHLRAYLRERMVVQEEEQFIKTGRKPYF